MPRQQSAGRSIAGGTCLLLGVLLIGAVLEIALLGSLKHARSQQVDYGRLRAQLATGVAPVGALDSEGRLLALGAPLAVLEIPRLGVREVVGEGTTSGVLLSGAGHLRTSVFPGQPGISTVFGRRAAFGGPFARLQELRPGDVITVVTGQGTHRYEVTGRRLAGDPVTPLVAGAGRLVLATATGSPFRPDGVLRVDAKLVSPAQPTPTRPAVSLLPAEAAMSGDTSALVPLLLWSQALLLAALAATYLRARWGGRQTWLVAVPVLLVLGLQVTDNAARLLPNLL